MVRAFVLVCAFAVLFAVASAAGEAGKEISCYTCSPCTGDNKVDETSKQCPTGVTECFTSEEGDGEKGCYSAEKCPDAKKCDKCDGNECNSAASITSSLFIGVVGAMLLKHYY